MTTQRVEQPATPSQLVAQEIRAELARQGRNQAWLARVTFHNQTWVSVRLSTRADVDMTVDEISQIAEALNVPVQRLLAAWLPRLDSNQQPSGYASAQVIDLAEARIRIGRRAA